MVRAIARFHFFVASICLFAFFQSARGQGSDALLARVHEAQANGAIDTPDMKPWHAKLTVQQFDDQGKPTEQGTIEEFWVNSQKRKVIYDFPSSKGIELVLGDKLYRTPELGEPPSRVDQLLTRWAHPITQGELQDAHPELHKEKFGKVELECITIAKKPNGGTALPPGMSPTFCFEPGQSVLRANFYASERYLRNGIGHFEGRDVPTQILLEEGGVKIASAQITSLKTFIADDAAFIPTPVYKPAGRLLHIAAGTANEYKISGSQPKYPEAAKLRHIQGSIVLRAKINTNGNLESVHPVGMGDPDLTEAALAAVKDWRYRPFMMDGEAVAVETSITVNFLFGRSSLTIH